MRRPGDASHLAHLVIDADDVEEVDAVAQAVASDGGWVLIERFTISGVRHLVFFEDSAGGREAKMIRMAH